MKMHTKLVLSFSLAICVPVVMLTVVFVKQSVDTKLQSFDQVTTREVAQIDRSFSIFMEAAVRNINYLAALPVLADELTGAPKFVDQGHIDQFSGWDAMSGTAREAWDVFDRFAAAQENYSYVYTGRVDGSHVEWPGSDYSTPYDPRQRPWYKQAVAAANEAIITDAYYFPQEDSTMIAIAKAIKNGLGELVGVVSIDVTLDEITKTTKAITIGESGYILLLESSGNVLVDPVNPENNFTQAKDIPSDFYQTIARKPEGRFEVVRDGISFFGNRIVSENQTWEFIALVPQSEVYAQARSQIITVLGIAIPVIVVFLMLAAYVARSITKNINEVSLKLHQISQGQGDLTKTLVINSNDEVGELAEAFNKFINKLRSIIAEIADLSVDIKNIADVSYDKANACQASTDIQLERITLVTAAVNEMYNATNAIASSADQSASAAKEGEQACKEGNAVVGKSVASIERLAGEVQTTNTIIGKLNEDSQRITSIIATIESIAEQTNLLALNAAIEAARAGEQGRGFAVVADEVRTLSQKTKASTEEIQTMIIGLQNTTQEAANVMEHSAQMTHESVQQASTAGQSIAELASTIDQIKGTAMHIARATEEQSEVCGDIKVNSQQVNDIAVALTDDVHGQFDRAKEFRRLSERLYNQISQFSI